MTHCEKLVDVGRRSFFARTAAGLAGATAAAALPTSSAQAAPALARVAYPIAKIAVLSKVKINEPVQIFYPDDDSPGVLIKFGARVEGGAGPDGDLVAFSTMCPHKGIPLAYSAEDRTLNCPGHYSRFDVEKGGLQIWGHATQNLPQFRLRLQGNDIYAEGVDELLYGRLSNVLTSAG